MPIHLPWIYTNKLEGTDWSKLSRGSACPVKSMPWYTMVIGIFFIKPLLNDQLFAQAHALRITFYLLKNVYRSKSLATPYKNGVASVLSCFIG
jgi:hypothetical protein